MDQLIFEQIMVVGDFNGTVDNFLDRRSMKILKNSEGKLPRSFFDFIDQEHLEDLWTVYNSQVRNYTYFPA